MNWHTKVFFWWIITAVLSVFVQMVTPNNLGIVIAVLMVPILIHDILINIVADKKQNGKK